MRSLRFIFPLFAIVALVYWSQRAFKDSTEPSVFDLPKTLSEEKLEILVRLHSTPGGAEVWSISKSGGTDDRLYLQSASPALTIPREYYLLRDSGFLLKLNGSFYKGKGIPQEYFGIRPTPARYPIFRYESLDVVKE